MCDQDGGVTETMVQPGAAIQAGPSCCLASVPYALFKHHAYRSKNTETLPPPCVRCVHMRAHVCKRERVKECVMGVDVNVISFTFKVRVNLATELTVFKHPLLLHAVVCVAFQAAAFIIVQ